MPLSRRASKWQRKEIARRIHVDKPRAPVPEHLRELYEKSTKGKSEEQKRKIHSITFSLIIRTSLPKMNLILGEPT